MSTRREHIETELELLELEEAFIASKKKGDRNDPARKKFSEARTYWRQIREAVDMLGGDDPDLTEAIADAAATKKKKG